MRSLIDTFLAMGADEAEAAVLAGEMNAVDYDDLMHRIDQVMDSNDGNGPDEVSDRESFEWLKLAAALASEYERRAFEI